MQIYLNIGSVVLSTLHNFCTHSPETQYVFTVFTSWIPAKYPFDEYQPYPAKSRLISHPLKPYSPSAWDARPCWYSRKPNTGPSELPPSIYWAKVSPPIVPNEPFLPHSVHKAALCFGHQSRSNLYIFKCSSWQKGEVLMLHPVALQRHWESLYIIMY